MVAKRGEAGAGGDTNVSVSMQILCSAVGRPTDFQLEHQCEYVCEDKASELVVVHRQPLGEFNKRGRMWLAD